MDLEILKDEYGRLRKEAYDVEARNDRILTLSSTFIILVFAYGFIEDILEIFIVSPFLLYALVLFTLHHLHFMYFRHGGMKAIELEINKRIKREVLFWESCSMTNYLGFKNAFPSFLYNMVMILYSGLIIAYSHVYLFIHNVPFFFIYLFVNIVFVLSLAFAWYRALSVSEVSYELYRTRLSERKESGNMNSK